MFEKIIKILIICMVVEKRKVNTPERGIGSLKTLYNSYKIQMDV